MTLSLEGVGVRAGSRVLISAFSLVIAPGEVVTLRGPSGVGKSSLLAFVGGALPAGLRGTGRVRLDGADIGHLPAHRRRIGLLFQDDLLFPHMSVGENLLFGLRPGAGGRAARGAAVARALEAVELAGMERRDPASLSGGQRARVALMRTLLSEPRALLLDEPFAGLDLPLRARLRALVLGQARARALPCLWVSHDAADGAGRDILFPGSDTVSRDCHSPPPAGPG